MIETNLTSDLCDERENQYETPLSHHERHLVAWVLHTLRTNQAFAERFDRERYTQGGQAA